MKTIAEQMNIKNVKDFPFFMYDVNGNKIYTEYLDHSWNQYKYDENNHIIYYESSSGYWYQNEFDEDGNEIYYENSDGEILDNRPVKEVSMVEVEEAFGCTVKIKK